MFLLVGASVRAIMESAVESGYEVMGIDFYGDVDASWQGEIISLATDCNLKPSVKNLLKTARKIPCTGLIYTSGPENAPRELMNWEKKGMLIGNGEAVLMKVRNPWVLSQILKQTGTSMPEFHSLSEWKHSTGSKRWLLKPVNRGGGHGIVELPQQHSDICELGYRVSQHSQYIIQEYVEGIPGSVTFLADGREALILGTSRQIIGRGNKGQFIYEGNIVPLSVKNIISPFKFKEEISKTILDLTRNTGLKGINTLDFIVNNEGIWILELNPRWSSSVELIEYVLGFRLFSAHLAACKGMGLELFNLEKVKPADQESNYWGKKIIYSRDPAIIPNYDENDLHYLYQQGIRDIPRPGTLIRQGQPVCTVLAKGINDSDCNRNLQRKTEWIYKLLIKSKMTPELSQIASV